MSTAPDPRATSLRVVCLSDTHGRHRELTVPHGDLLIHAGDLTERGTPAELTEAFEWLGALPHRHKIAIAGNHDFALEHAPAAVRGLVPPSVTYLEGDSAEVEGLLVWGGPWTPRSGPWAFEADAIERRAHWAAIPDDVEILVTHGPAARMLDGSGHGGQPGCELLAQRVRELARLRLHVHGHVHEARGSWTGEAGRQVVNAACHGRIPREALQPPIVVELERRADDVAAD
jgi:Icc-related predicted phosphoesterase